jgi:hypothetical protein
MPLSVVRRLLVVRLLLHQYAQLHLKPFLVVVRLLLAGGFLELVGLTLFGASHVMPSWLIIECILTTLVMSRTPQQMTRSEDLQASQA